MTIQSYAIAAGYNVALGSLVNIETITPSGDIPFYPCDGFWHASPGQARRRLNGLSYRTGFPYVTWNFGVLTQKQFQYLRTTYCGGDFTGQVTIYTKVSGTSYARYNAVLDVTETDLARRLGNWFEGAEVKFTRLVAL